LYKPLIYKFCRPHYVENSAEIPVHFMTRGYIIVDQAVQIQVPDRPGDKILYSGA